MRFPLFVTLTMANVEDLDGGAVRKLRRAFGKLRHKRIWKDRVRGGVACIEVTNIGNGWHPHLHAVIDCRWLAIKTPAPRNGEALSLRRAKYKAAAAEFSEAWAKCLGQTMASVKVKRAEADEICREVVKYSVKGSDLLECVEPIGDLIRCLEMTRLMTTFGTLFGHGRRARAEAEARLAEAEETSKDNTEHTRSCEAGNAKGPCSCCQSPSPFPAAIFDRCNRSRGITYLSNGNPHPVKGR